MFRKPPSPGPTPSAPVERVTTVLGPGIRWNGSMRGTGGVRIEGPMEGEISIRGLVVVGETGRVTCDNLRANTVVIAGAVRGNITAEKIEIRATGRVWGDVVTVAFSTEEGAFLRGQVRMEERVDLNFDTEGETQPIDSSFPTDANKTPPIEPKGS
jgi:cytoskeletal protein CcmA (bactofilin family)